MIELSTSIMLRKQTEFGNVRWGYTYSILYRFSFVNDERVRGIATVGVSGLYLRTDSPASEFYPAHSTKETFPPVVPTAGIAVEWMFVRRLGFRADAMLLIGAEPAVAARISAGFVVAIGRRR
jgi:hypothetical protein